MMAFGVAWRGVAVMPPTEDELSDFIDALGFGDQDRELSRHVATQVAILGTIRRRATGERLGTVVLMPAGDDGSTWDYSIEISDPKHREAFSAIHASDATAYYMFSHVACDAVLFRIEEANLPAQAIAKRIGYAPGHVEEVEGVRVIHYRLDAETWAARRKKLERGSPTDSGAPPRFEELRDAQPG